METWRALVTVPPLERVKVGEFASQWLETMVERPFNTVKAPLVTTVRYTPQPLPLGTSPCIYI